MPDDQEDSPTWLTPDEAATPGGEAEGAEPGLPPPQAPPGDAQPGQARAAAGAPPADASAPPPQGAVFTPVPPAAGSARYPRGARPGRPGNRTWLPWLGGGCIGCAGALLLLVLGVAVFAPFAGGMRGTLPGGEKIGLISVEGMILAGSGGGGLFGAFAGSDAIVRQLVYARRDSSIKAVVLRINSPGGSAAASQEIYEEVMKLRRTRKPVVVSMGDVAASGGYYVASAADKIVANGSTMTGSIGVIMEYRNLQGLYGKVGIDNITIKSGKYKDIGSSTRPLTTEERRLLQAMVDDVYDQFVTAVSEGRKQVGRAAIRRIADGRVLTGRQAMKLKLVDELGNLQDAIGLAGRAAGISGRPTVVELGRRSFIELLAGGEPSYDGHLRLPNSGRDEERLVRALRWLMQEQAVPR